MIKGHSVYSWKDGHGCPYSSLLSYGVKGEVCVRVSKVCRDRCSFTGCGALGTGDMTSAEVSGSAAPPWLTDCLPGGSLGMPSVTFSCMENTWDTVYMEVNQCVYVCVPQTVTHHDTHAQRRMSKCWVDIPFAPTRVVEWSLKRKPPPLSVVNSQALSDLKFGTKKLFYLEKSKVEAMWFLEQAPHLHYHITSSSILCPHK